MLQKRLPSSCGLCDAAAVDQAGKLPGRLFEDDDEDENETSLHLKCEDTRQFIGVQKPQQRIPQTSGPAE